MRSTLGLFASYFERRWLLRAYFIGLLIFCFTNGSFLFAWRGDGSWEPPENSFDLIAFAVFTPLNLLLFPFSKMVWNSTRDFLLGDTVIFSAVIILFPLKFFINLALFQFAIVIAPIGIAYVFFVQRRNLRAVETNEPGE